MSELLEKELSSFQSIWKGGYYEGDPLDPIGRSGYGHYGYISSLYATYLKCIKPYISNQTSALEIGPGRGAWTKTMLKAKKVTVLDALSANHNQFHKYLRFPTNVTYHHISDFNCKMLLNNSFTYMFSFGCLCHVSFDGITQYAKNIFPKLKNGSNCFWMVADYDKYNKALKNIRQSSIVEKILPENRYWLFVRMLKLFLRKEIPHYRNKNEDLSPRPGRWYHAGIERTCSMLRSTGYHIVESDVDTCIRDPIIHFIKQ